MNTRKISASLWSTDLSNIADGIKKVDAYVDSYHFDLMDNHYVPGFLFSAPIIKALRGYTTKDFDVHLMCQKPETLLEELVDAGADTFMIHFGTTNLEEIIKQIKGYHKKVGLVLNIEESVDLVVPYLDDISVVVLMGTALGIKGANFDETVYEKIKVLSELSNTKKFEIQIDGGIRNHTVPQMIASGANVITAGSLLFQGNYEGVKEWYNTL